MKFKKLAQILSFSAASTFLVPSCAVFNNDIKYEPGETIAKREEDKRAHYLKDLPKKSEIAEMSSFEKQIETLISFLKDAKNNEFGSTTIITNRSAKAKVDINGQEIELKFPFYKPHDEDTWTYIINNEKVKKDKIIKDLKGVLEDAVDMAYEQYRDTSKKTNQKMDMIFPNIDEDANKKIKDSDLTISDVLKHIELNKEDFLPDGSVIFFGPLRGGTYAITELENNKIVYSPTARKQDYLWGGPFIMAHELIHNNSKMQGLPSVIVKDLEIQAFQINLLNKESIFNFMFHSYAKDLRRFAEIYFGKDFENIREKMINREKSAYRYVELDEEYIKTIMPEINEVAGELQDVFINEAMTEYLSFKPYWEMLNIHLFNMVAPTEIMLSKNLEPAMEGYESFVKKNDRKIDGIINFVNNSYMRKNTKNSGFFAWLNAYLNNYRNTLLKKSKMEGFNEKQSEIIYHLALKNTFLKEDGGINYGAMDLRESFNAMDMIVGEMENALEKYTDWAKNSSLQKKLKVYSWYLDRLEKAKRYSLFARTYGSKVSSNFQPKILDPRVVLEEEYKHMPDFVKYATPINGRFVEQLDVDQNNLPDVKIVAYDLIKSVGFDRDGIDYVECFREGEDKPFMKVFPSKYSRKPDLALIDDDKKDEDHFGKYDKIERIEKFEDIKELAKEKNN